MSHNHKLLIGAVALVKGRVRNDIPALTTVRDEIEELLSRMNWFEAAPFKIISLIIRYGTKTNLDPEIQPIRRRDGELPIIIELEMERLRTVHKDKSKLERIFRSAIMKALISIAERFDLSRELLEEEISVAEDDA